MAYDFAAHHKEYTEEDDELFNQYLADTFYKRFKEEKSDSSIEIIFSPDCNLGCKYCYVKRFYHKTFPIESFDAEASIENVLHICRWMVKNGFTNDLDIFSGELFAQECGYTLLEKICGFYEGVEPHQRPKSITVPTNFTFITSDDCTRRVESLIEKFHHIGMIIALSSSFDGKYMESNRPWIKDMDIRLKADRDDAYYDKVFDFLHRTGSGLHPMVYSGNIGEWKNNFLWFQGMMESHGIPWQRLFLLHVRNYNWNREDCHKLYDFIRFLIDYAWQKVGMEKEKMLSLLFAKDEYNIHGFNILTFMLSAQDRYTCGIQKELSIRANDMKVFPCHRLMYPELEIGQYEKVGDDDLVFHTKNVSLGLNIYGASAKTNPMCSTCPINELCVGGCLGSQYEVTHSLTAPIPSVCMVHHYIIKALYDGYTSIGIAEEIMGRMPKVSREQFKAIGRIDK